jgi:signal transduction histidine kinase
LIESLLTLARSEAAAGRESEVDIAALAGECVTDLQARANEADLDLRLGLQPARVRGDERLLERLIANLVDNGIRHNARGGFLEVATRTRDGRVELRVCNGGPMIDQADAATLTEPFRRLDRSFGGFGLGLSIVRSVAEAHGGWLEVQARSLGGLEVRVEMPALPAPPSARDEELMKSGLPLTKS